MKFQFDQEKALAVVLYVTHKILELGERPDLHKIFKILYFADQKHLVKWGRPVSTDYFIAMKHGPVPSAIYDILKSARGDSRLIEQHRFSRFFEVHDHFVKPKQPPKTEILSESDLAALDEAISENVRLGFAELEKKSHGKAWRSAGKDDRIPFKFIAQEAGATSEMVSYIRHNAEIDNLTSFQK